jgi:phosphoglycolate phosphatase-like HAD superfamily hydrolase
VNLARPVLLLFDIDGTLVDADGAGRAALDAAFAQAWNLESATRDVVLAGGTDPEIVREILLAKLGLTTDSVTPGMIKGVLAGYLAQLPACLAAAQSFRVLPGVRELLPRLRQPGVFTALATGNIPAAARLKLAKAQLNSFFRTGGFGGEAPTRAGILHVAQERMARIAGARFERRRVFVVGDTVRDVKAAHAVGVVAVGVASGPDDEDALRQAGADIVLGGLDQAEALLGAL